MASIRQWPKRLWNRINPPISAEQRAVVPFDVYGNSDLGIKTASGARVTEESAFKYSVAYAAMTLIADGISSLPPTAMKELEDGSMETRTNIPRWIVKPHPELRRFDIWNQLMLSLLAWGNAYAMIIRRPTDNVIIALDVLDPDAVHVEWHPDKPYARRYKINSQGRWYDSSEIFHIQGPTLPGQAAGLSVIAQAREAIGLGLTLEEFGSRYFGQGSQAKIVIEMPQSVESSEAARIVKTYERFHKGPGNWHRPAIMSGGAKLHNISIPPDDAQFLESRQFQAIDVARWFRVPPHRVGIIGVQTSWGSGLAEENLAMLQHTYRPWITRFEAALTSYSPGSDDAGTLIFLKTEALTRGTYGEQVENYTTLFEKGLITRDEGRIPLGFPKAAKDGDSYYYMPPMTTLDEDGELVGTLQDGTDPNAPGGSTSGGSSKKTPNKGAPSKAADKARKQKEAKQ